MLGLGFPGGPAIDRVASTGDPMAIPFPRFQGRKGNLEFSFSGLKTSLLYKLRDMSETARVKQIADLAAGYQEAIVQVLVAKAFSALARERLTTLGVVGGVSANSRLRTLLKERAAGAGVRLALPPLTYCTDNAAMIALAGRHALLTRLRPVNEIDIQLSLPCGSPHGFSKEVSHS